MTKVSLRKAKVLQNLIQDEISNLPIVTEVEISEFDFPETKIEKFKDDFYKNVLTRRSLLEAMHCIRISVGEANASSGVSSLLGRLAKHEKEIALFSKLSRLKPKTEMKIIKGQLGKIRDAKEDSYGRSDTVDTSIFDAMEIKEFKITLAEKKKHKQDIQDNLLDLNVKTEITLSPETTKTLKSENIL